MGPMSDQMTTLTRPTGGPVGGDAPAAATLYLRRVYTEVASAGIDAVYPVTLGQSLVFGRAPGAGPGAVAVPDDAWSSRRHAEVSLDPGASGLVVTDLGSRNGTYVAGRRITEPTPAPAGQVLQVGGSVYVVGLELPEAEDLPAPPPGFACASWQMRRLWARALRLAADDCAVLLTGEMGTGKTRLARLIHDHGPRRDRPFVAHNCSAIPTNLEEATLFGVVGGFIPGVKAQTGLLSRAGGGTLFLDELADLPERAQARVLDAFDPNGPSYLAVGGTRRQSTDCRLISATNRDVFQLAAAGVIRHDLLSRMVVGQIEVPPLRERREDLLGMFAAALQRAGVADLGAAVTSAEIAQALLLAGWVENVRGLESLARRVALGEGLTPELVSAHADRAGATAQRPRHPCSVQTFR